MNGLMGIYPLNKTEMVSFGDTSVVLIEQEY
jgi:hypothetical protein